MDARKRQFMHQRQGRSKVFEGGVAKVYIPHVASRGVWGHAPPGNFFVKLDARKSLLRLFYAPNLKCSAVLSKQNFNSASRTLCEVVIPDCA